MNILKVFQIELKIIWNKFKKLLNENPINMLVYILFFTFVIYQIYQIRYSLFSNAFVPQTNVNVDILYIITTTILVGAYFYYLLDSAKANAILRSYIPIPTKTLLKIESIKNLIRTVIVSIIFYLLISVSTINRFTGIFYVNELLAILYMISFIILGITIYILFKKFIGSKFISLILFQTFIISILYFKSEILREVYEVTKDIRIMIGVIFFSLLFYILFESKDLIVRRKKLFQIKLLEYFPKTTKLFLIQILRIDSIWLYFVIAISYLIYSSIFSQFSDHKFDIANVIAFFVLSLSLTLVVKYKIIKVLESLPDIKLRLQIFEVIVLGLSGLVTLLILVFSKNLILETSLYYLSISILVIVILYLLKLDSISNFISLIFVLITIILYQFLIPFSYSFNSFIQNNEVYLIIVVTLVYISLFVNFLKEKKNDFI